MKVSSQSISSLTEAAKDRAPCVIFIDEIDSVGAKRTNSVLHPYANQVSVMLISKCYTSLSSEIPKKISAVP